MARTLDLLQGTLDLLILKTLASGGSMHGFDVLESITRATDGALVIEEGSLYPALHRLQQRGLIDAEWGVSPKGRRAKYYALSTVGREELARQSRRWTDYVAAVDKVGARSSEA